MPYLDHASTSFPKPLEVGTSICEYLTQFAVSPGRGNYFLAAKAQEWVEETRSELAKLLGVKPVENLIFTQNATHALNLILKGYLRECDHVLICQFSHNAALRPLELLRREKNVTYEVISIDEEGSVDLQKFQNELKKKPRLLIATQASNVIGVIADFAEAFALCLKASVPILIDTTQSLGYTPTYQADFLVGTGHKTLLGPSGIGFAYIKNPDLVSSFMEGGSPGNSSLALLHPEKMPYKFEAGTANSLGISGLKGALSYIQKQGFPEICCKSNALLAYMMQELSMLPNIQIYGTKDLTKKIPIISFNLKGWLPSQVAYELDARHQICVRAGLHCAPLIHQKLGTAPTGTIRASLGYFNSFEDINLLIHTLHNLALEI